MSLQTQLDLALSKSRERDERVKAEHAAAAAAIAAAETEAGLVSIPSYIRARTFNFFVSAGLSRVSVSHRSEITELSH